MTDTAPHPDLMICIPPLRERNARERWTVAMQLGSQGAPSTARFLHRVDGAVMTNHLAGWQGQWLAPLPASVPTELAARAHRVLRHRAGRPGGPVADPMARLAEIRQARADRDARSIRPTVLKP
jgi:hypothetical protein